MVNENDVINIVIHGRGGQGAVTASQIIVESAFLSGNFVDVQAYPSFGAERRGAPIQAYAKLSRNEKIWDRSEIEQADILIVLDESVLTQDIISSLKRGGTCIINSANNPNYFVDKYKFNENVKIIIVDVSKLAIDNNLTIEGAPIVNIPILGLLMKAIPELSLENLKKIICKRIGSQRGKLNFELLEKGFKLAKLQ
jgi:2-oxoacid:acceptor oxidoreductase gamma subunit (pyruvate/2-ketoisovalerate family)